MKTRTQITVISIAVFFIFIKNGYSQDIILSSEAKIPLNITSSMEVFRDSSSTIPFDKIPGQNFKKLTKPYFLFPYSNDVFWVRLVIKNTNTHNKDWVLQWINPLAEQLDFYLSDSTLQHFDHTEYKLITSQKKKKFIEDEPSLSFFLGPNTSKTLYIKVTSQRGQYGSLIIHSAHSMTQKRLDNYAEQSTINGLLFFRLFLIIILAVFIIKISTFRLYSLHAVLKTFTYWGMMNIVGPLFTNNPDIAKKLNFLSYNSIVITSCLFILSALSMNKLPKWNNFILYFFIVCSIVLDILVVIDYKWYWLKSSLYLIVFSSFYFLFLYAYCISKRMPISTYYSVPFLLGTISFLLINLRLLGWLEYKPLFSLSSLLFVAENFIFVFYLGQIFRDAERNKQVAEQKLDFNIEQNLRLKELDNLKTTFFANISHELRTPLTLIIGPIQELLQRYPADSLLPLVQRNTQRLLTLINQLLDISKLEAGQMKVEVSKQNITKYFRTLTSSFTSLAESRNIQFDTISNQQDLEGYIDKDKLDKIITNLLSNAFKFIQKEGIVSARLNYSTDLKTISIEISDNGIGIHKDKLDKIFDRFFQVDSSQNRKFEGTGIGLALVKELVDVLKGSISVESQELVGTTFTVKLPIDQATWQNNIVEAVIEEPDLGTSVLSGNNLKKPAKQSKEPADQENILLIVDDNADIRSYIRSIFDKDYQIIEAVNGKEGILKATERIPDLIISDLMMPEMDGFEFCKRLKSDEKTSHIPIIMLTAKANIESRIEGFELGADEYLIKPFNTNEIVARVKNLILTRESLKKYFTKDIIELKPSEIKVNSIDKAFIIKAKSIIEKNLSNSQFDLENFAQEMSMSTVQLRRKIKALTNNTVIEFIRHYRLHQASNLLKQKSGTVSDIAYQVGFESLSYFTKMFQEEFGMTPSEYIAANHDK